MSDGLAYRFETDAQWRECLHIALPERLGLGIGDGTDAGQIGGDVEAFAVNHDGIPLWTAADGTLRLDEDCAGPRLDRVRRLVFGRRQIWALIEGGIARLDGSSLQLIETIEREDVLDIAGDGSDGLWLLTNNAFLQLDAQGRQHGTSSALDNPVDQIAAAGGTLALFARVTNQLNLRRKEEPPLTAHLAAILGPDEPEFVADGVAGDGERFLLQGEWRSGRDGTRTAGFLLLDPAGAPGAWGEWRGAAPIALALAGGDLVAVFTEGGKSQLRRFTGAAEAGGSLWLTPTLESDTIAGDWLRADLRAALPEGATLAVRVAASRDERDRTAADLILRNDSLLIGDRVRALGNRLDWSKPRTFVGEGRDGPVPIEDFAFPLHEAQGNFLWLEISLDRNQAAAKPALASLVVTHDAPSLMDYLPAIYRMPDGDLDGTLRRLVGVLEATTDGIDARIAGLADALDPARAEQRWLPGLAALLGLPFDAALSVRQQRQLVRAAPAILAGRGTRAGVLALLEALFGDRRYRVIDRTEQLLPITLGGGSVGGSRLPAYLSGPSQRIAKLNARLVLGKTALCKADPCDPLSVEPPPELLVIIPARGGEERRYGPAVHQMLEQMVPAGVRLRVQWAASGSSAGEAPALVEEAQTLVLGHGQPLGGARIGGDPTFRLRDGGMPAEHRLQ